MTNHPARIIAGLALLILVWIGVYWWWDPREPKITYASQPLAEQPTQVQAAPPLEPQPAEPAQPGQLAQPRVVQGVLPPEFDSYTVKRGDSFPSIAQRLLGSSSHADAIARANPYVDPRRLKEGQPLRIPRDPSNVQGKVVEVALPEPAPQPAAPEPQPPPAPEPRTYTVRSGDTLSEIAAKTLGSSRHTRLLFEANRATLASPDDLKVGQTLIVPEKPAR